MVGRNNDIIGTAADDVDEIRRKSWHGRAGGRHVLLGEKLADQTLVRSGLFRQVSRMGLMVGTRLAGDVRPDLLSVVMEGHKKHRR